MKQVIRRFFARDVLSIINKHLTLITHQNAENISDLSAIISAICYSGKTNFQVQRNFNTNTALVALLEIRFRSLYF